MGASIGTREGDTSGTLGGFIDLKVGHRLHHGFLTNHHIMIPQFPGQLENSFQYLSNSDSRPIVQIPSPEDFKITHTTLLEDIEDCKKLVDDCETQQAERLEARARMQPGLEKMRHGQLELIENKQKQLSQFKDRYPVNLGCPLVSSGDGITSGLGTIDWAFVELSEELQQSLGPSFPLLNHLAQDDPGNMLDREARFVLLPPVATCFGEMKKGSWYYKRGRTSGITVGKCNGTEMDINRTDSDHNCTGDAQPYNPDQSSTRELIILGCERKHAGPIAQSSFSEPRDSGSLVIDQQGRVCGLLYGEHTGLCGPRHNLGAGLVTSFADVQKSVALRTQMTDSNGRRFAWELVLPEPV